MNSQTPHPEDTRCAASAFRALYDFSLDGVALTAPDGRMFAANPAFCEMFGLTEDELIFLGRSGVADMADERWDDALAERQETGRVRAELPFFRRDGERFMGEMMSVLYRQPETSGTGDQTVVVLRDVTETAELIDRLNDLVSQMFFNLSASRTDPDPDPQATPA